MDIHIITLNIPWPPDYGGIIDTYYRIRSLHDIGVKIHLHCFEYGRQRPEELEKLCETISYYRRKTGLGIHFSLKPYIVKSRHSKKLVSNLLKDNYPILYDGLHTTLSIENRTLHNRIKIVRLHNVEHLYYSNLALHEKNIFRRLYFRIEAYKLRRYQRIIQNADLAFSISGNDQKYFSRLFKNTRYLAPFHPFDEIVSKPGKGDYIVYHGDLSVGENAAVAQSLIENVFSKIHFRCIIAGKDPPEYLRASSTCYENIDVVANPPESRMKDLIESMFGPIQ